LMIKMTDDLNAQYLTQLADHKSLALSPVAHAIAACPTPKHSSPSLAKIVRPELNRRLPRHLQLRSRLNAAESNSHSRHPMC
jgi:hypothetical protein